MNSAVARTRDTDADARLVLRPLATPFDAAAWDDLVAAAAEPNPFGERWFLEATRALPDTSDVVIAEAWRDGRLIATLPLAIESHYGRLPLAHVENWQGYHAFLGIPLLRAGHEVAGWQAIIAGLDRDPFARGLLHFVRIMEDGPAHRALIEAARNLQRPCATVHRIARATLESDLSPDAYLAANVRGKKRKEWRRLEARLRELGALSVRHFNRTVDDIREWTEAYLDLETRGWKGQAGSALGQTHGTRRFFADILSHAAGSDRLDMVRLDLDGRPLAMLATLLAGNGGFAFKTAFDEEFARFSPGVLLQLVNLDLPGRRGLAFVDSCATANHSMIDQIWAERRALVRMTLPLAGKRGTATFALARLAETASARLKDLRR